MPENPNWKDYWETTKMDRHYQAKLSREGYRPEPGRQVVAVWAKTLSSGNTRMYLLWSSAELVQRTIRGQDTGGWAEGKRFKKYSNSLLIDIDTRLRNLGFHRNYVMDTGARLAVHKQGLSPERRRK